MIYDNGIFVNDQIGISATFSLVALGVSILGMVLQILAGILLFRGAAHIAKQEGLRGLAVAFRIVGACSLAFGGYSVNFPDSCVPLSFCDLISFWQEIRRNKEERRAKKRRRTILWTAAGAPALLVFPWYEG